MYARTWIADGQNPILQGGLFFVLKEMGQALDIIIIIIFQILA